MSEKDLYYFNIIAEAKISVLVWMMRKYHPEWEDKKILEHLTRGIELALEKGRPRNER